MTLGVSEITGEDIFKRQGFMPYKLKFLSQKRPVLKHTSFFLLNAIPPFSSKPPPTSAILIITYFVGSSDLLKKKKGKVRVFMHTQT